MNFNRAVNKVILAIVVCLSLNLNAQNQSSLPVADVSAAFPVEEKPYTSTAKLTALIIGRDIDDNYAHANQGLTILNPEMNVKYGDYITVNLDFVGLFATGNASNFWTEDGKASNTILLSDCYARFNFHKNISVRAGALKSTINPISSIMPATFGGAFMGAQEEWQIGADESNLTLTAYQAIPSSGTVSKRIYDDGTQAYFLSQTAIGKFKSNKSGTELKVAGTRFQFENLSTNVANDSYFLGNSLSAFEGSSKAFRFRHGFMGTEVAGSLKQDVGRHEAAVFVSHIVNDQAPENKDRGNIRGASVKLVKGNYTFKPSYSEFNYDADVTPVTYTTVTSRFQNRTGYRVGFDIELKKEKLALRNYYIKMDLKDQNPYLADREIYNIALEAKYDIF